MLPRAPVRVVVVVVCSAWQEVQVLARDCSTQPRALVKLAAAVVACSAWQHAVTALAQTQIPLRVVVGYLAWQEEGVSAARAQTMPLVLLVVVAYSPWHPEVVTV